MYINIFTLVLVSSFDDNSFNNPVVFLSLLLKTMRFFFSSLAGDKICYYQQIVEINRKSLNVIELGNIGISCAFPFPDILLSKVTLMLSILNRAVVIFIRSAAAVRVGSGHGRANRTSTGRRDERSLQKHQHKKVPTKDLHIYTYPYIFFGKYI